MQMLRSLSIDTEINKEDLLKTLIANRERHTAMYQESLKGYVATVKSKLESALRRLEDGRATSVNISLQVPSDHTKEYDTVIGMFEKDVRSTVKLNAPEYRMLVEDEWDWSDRWLLANSAFSGTAREYAASKGLDV